MYWGVVPDLLARFQTRKPTEKSQAFLLQARAILGAETDKTLLALHRTNEGAVHQRMIIVAAHRRRGGWNPEIVLTGRERLDRAHAKGRGVILWSDSFAHAAVIGKRALAEAGFRCWHLSTSGHGILNSPLANRYLNPRVIEAELRYLAGRIVFERSAPTAAVRRMIKVLSENGLVSLTNNAFAGKGLATPFGKGAELLLAQTPLRLAAIQRVPLLPFQMIERDRFHRYEVILGPDLSETPRADSADALQAVASAYAAYLIERVQAHPEQFSGWPMVRLLDQDS